MGWDPHPRIDAQDGQTLEAVLLWIDKEPLKGSLVFIVGSVHQAAFMCLQALKWFAVLGGMHVADDGIGARTQAADIIGVTVLFPGAIFAMAGGAIFGIGYGSLLVWIATSLGQTLAFIVGRWAAPGSALLICTAFQPSLHLRGQRICVLD